MTIKRFGVTPIIACSLLATPGVQAQESSGFELEEITVTARKREENLQSTPIAVSAFTEKELEYRQITSTDSLSDITPNLTFDSAAPSSGSSSAAQIFIRGIGQTDFTAVTDPGVGLYIDGVYMARSVGNVLDFLDVERIEILRGPQGTLFGRNTIGGAISIHSKRPHEEKTASIKVEVGDDDMRNVTFKANMPITDTLFSNVAIASKKRDGYVNRSFDGIDLGDDDSLAFRGSLLWDASEDVQVFLTADATKIRENGAPGVSGGVNDAQAFAHFGNALLASCTGISINPNFGINPGPPSFPPPGGGSGGAAGCVGPQSFDDEYTSNGTFPVQSDLDVWGLSGEISWSVSENFSIKSITAYREADMHSSRDGDHTPANIFATMDFFEQEQFSQEIQFAGTLNDNVNWLLGLYYFQEEGFNENPVTLPVGSIRSGGIFDNESEAIFFQTTIDITEQLALTLGIRNTKDTKNFKPDQISLGDASATGFFNPTWPGFAGFYLPPGSSGNPPLAAGTRLATFANFEEEFDDTNSMINLSYQWTDDLMVYATYSEGFKSGGFDQRFTALTAVPSSFQPETVDSYEVGMKGDFFDSTLRLNLAVFHTDYNDLQIIIRESFNPITFNGGKAEIDGFELELTWVPTDNWFITAATGYVDADYVELSSRVLNNNTPVLPGNSLSNTPMWSASLGIAYTTEIGDWATVTPRIDWSFHDEQYNDAVNEPLLFQDDYYLLNAAVSMETLDGKWEAVLAVKNIEDETYLVTGNSAFGTAAAYTEQVYNRPREWSLSVQYNFF